MNLTHILKHVTDALWLLGGIGAAAELGLEGVAPEGHAPGASCTLTPCLAGSGASPVPARGQRPTKAGHA